MKRESGAPHVIAIELLILLALYLGSYVALVVPSGIITFTLPPVEMKEWDSFSYSRVRHRTNYRFGGLAAATIYWPLEQIDRRLRPDAWRTKPSTWHR